jgi:exonuclease SbcD
MTRVVHTADAHLSTTDDERMAALRAVLERAETEDAEVVTIGGDLFDQPEDVERLRTALRNDLFSDQPFEILLIPGNHDIEAFRRDVFFGDSCTVMTDEPYEHWTGPRGDLRVTGLPYREHPDDDLLLALQDRPEFDGTEALLLHCSLDAPIDADTGDEGTRRYFPVKEGVLTELGFDLYLAGHYHSSHTVKFDDGSAFTYPGTPASTSSAETGRRHASVYDTEDGLSLVPLDTYHRVHREVTVIPGEGRSVLEEIERWTDHIAADADEATLRVEGYTERPEDEFDEDLRSVATPARVTNETRGVRHVKGHPLFRAFEEELETTDWDEETEEAVRQRTLAVFSQLGARGDL